MNPVKDEELFTISRLGKRFFCVHVRNSLLISPLKQVRDFFPAKLEPGSFYFITGDTGSRSLQAARTHFKKCIRKAGLDPALFGLSRARLSRNKNQ